MPTMMRKAILKILFVYRLCFEDNKAFRGVALLCVLMPTAKIMIMIMLTAKIGRLLKRNNCNDGV